MTSLRELAGTEARRLREARRRPGVERREMLADLVSRLDALLAHLASLGVPDSALAPVRTLVERLRAGGDLDRLWDEAVRVLELFAATTTVLAPAPVADDDGADRRRGFWKR
jgi:Ca-activated chloride channel family protein